jgi:LuxR family maltose regulon positive regulatory protein
MAGDAELARGWQALGMSAWGEAREAFQAALDREETPEALEGLGVATGWLGDARTSVAVRERAYHGYRRRGDDEAAARAAIGLAQDLLTFQGQPAVASGWLQRARRVLADRPGSPQLVAADVVESGLAREYERDLPRARRLAAEARDRARRIGAFDLEMIALGQLGSASVGAGELAGGMRMLDEATAAVTGGEVADPATRATICCFLVWACARTRDLDRAAQWSRYVLDMARGPQDRPLLSHPLAEHAEVLIWWGRWPEAERELLDVIGDAVGRPVPAAGGRLRLADLRRRQGRLDEAAALLDELDASPGREGLGPLPLAVRAALALDQGRPAGAADLAGRYLRAVPAGDLVERVDALEVLARAKAALGDPGGAELAATELAGIAAAVPTGPVQAAGMLAAGVAAAARGDGAAARAALEGAADRYEQAGAPFEAARARLELAGCLLAAGAPEPAVVQARAARAALAGLGSAHELRRAERLLAGVPAPRSSTGLALTDREVEVVRLVARGRTNEEIAAELVLSVRTVERHLSNLYVKVGASGRTARAVATAYALTHGLA